MQAADAVGADHQEIHGAGEQVAGRHRQQVERHHQRFQELGRLGVGIFQAGDRHQDLGRGQDAVIQQLPTQAGPAAGVDAGLQPGRQHEGQACQQHADAYPPQRRQPDMALQRRVEAVKEQRRQQQDQQRIGRLDLRRQDSEPQHDRVHVPGLQHPGRAGLVEQRPEHGDERIDQP